MTAEASPLAVVDSSSGRGFVYGGNSARAFDLHGKSLFEVPLGDFALSTAATLRFSARDDPDLVLVGSTDRDTGRYRLLIVNAKLQVVYDEILDQYPRALVAKQGDGSDTLFVNAGQALRQLRRR